MTQPYRVDSIDTVCIDDDDDDDGGDLGGGGGGVDADNFSACFCPLVSELCQVKVWLVDQLLIIKVCNKSQASIF